MSIEEHRAAPAPDKIRAWWQPSKECLHIGNLQDGLTFTRKEALRVAEDILEILEATATDKAVSAEPPNRDELNDSDLAALLCERWGLSTFKRGVRAHVPYGNRGQMATVTPESLRALVIRLRSTQAGEAPPPTEQTVDESPIRVMYGDLTAREHAIVEAHRWQLRHTEEASRDAYNVIVGLLGLLPFAELDAAIAKSGTPPLPAPAPPEPPNKMKFRKTALVEATQWFKMGDHPAVVPVPYDHPTNLHALKPGDWGWCPTLEGGHLVEPGDWILTGVQGEHWPCKADIFAKTYEPAESTPAVSADRQQVHLERKIEDLESQLRILRREFADEKVCHQCGDQIGENARCAECDAQDAALLARVEQAEAALLTAVSADRAPLEQLISDIEALPRYASINADAEPLHALRDEGMVRWTDLKAALARLSGTEGHDA